MDNPDNVNVFEVLPAVDELVFEQNRNLMPQHPFRMICVGSSGAGKTQSVMNRVIRRDFKWDKIYLYAADLEEPKYQQFITFMKEVASEAGVEIDDILCVGNKPEHIIDLDLIDRTRQNLIIYDDFVTHKKANAGVIQDMFIRGRKLNCSIIYLTQIFYGVPKAIRMQAGYFMLFRPENNRDKTMIASELCDTKIEPEILAQMIDFATERPFGFLLVDKTARDRRMKYRIGFEQAIRLADQPVAIPDDAPDAPNAPDAPDAPDAPNAPNDELEE